ncbi:hypothetical protein HSIEG1_1424 [Enterococcus sp. HSIEG1]|nr:hypothetical protein HSIEG1_1424 [Enterococcus sp. HSIEG1]
MGLIGQYRPYFHHLLRQQLNKKLSKRSLIVPIKGRLAKKSNETIKIF